MNTVVKGILLVVVTCVITMVVAALVSVVIVNLMEPKGCSDIGQAMLVLWGTIAALFLASTVVVGVMSWRMVPNLAGRLAIVLSYGAVMLVSFVIIAFGLMVAFNC